MELMKKNHEEKDFREKWFYRKHGKELSIKILFIHKIYNSGNVNKRYGVFHEVVVAIWF